VSDALNELVEYRGQYGLSPMLKRLQTFHNANPEVLDFLVQELREVRASGWRKTSVGSLWHHARWVLTQTYRAPGETFVMSNNFFPHYERVIVILHPDMNGFFEMAKSKADEDFGTRLETATKNPKPGHIRRLLWADGRAIEDGWRPTIQHEPKPVARRERVTRKPAGSVPSGGVHHFDRGQS
jgi:hypothetical protein